VRPHHEHSSSPSTSFIHRQRAASVWTINVGRRLLQPSPSVVVGIGACHRQLLVGRLRGPRGSSSPTTDVKDGRQPRGSSTPPVSDSNAWSSTPLVSDSDVRSTTLVSDIGRRSIGLRRWRSVDFVKRHCCQPRTLSSTYHVFSVGSGFNIFGIGRPRCTNT